MAITIAALIPVSGAQAAQPVPSANYLKTYAALTSVDPDCRRARQPDEIVICGRRDADRYRLPLVQRDPGDPAAEGVSGERERLQHITTPCQEGGPFLVGCGMVGVHMSVGLGDGKPVYRPLAK